MSNEADPNTITFGDRTELDPAKAEEYRQKISKARKDPLSSARGSTPVGGIPRPPMPLLVRQPRSMEEEVSGGGGVVPRPPGSPPVTGATQAQIGALDKALKEQEGKKADEPESKSGRTTEEDDESFMSLLTQLSPDKVAERILKNPKVRTAVESRCSEMRLEDLFLRGEVRQTVPIIPKTLEVTFRTNLPEESLFIKVMMSKEKIVSDIYAQEKFGLFQLCCALVAVNGTDLPSHLDEKGVPQEELFNAKYARMMRFSGHLLDFLYTNLQWFDIRVRKLLTPEKMFEETKNG